ncbi:MAG: LCP family protein [Lactobacillaceae bacterium]|jgi:LCP family protein required for cell wall assembly|nr:LCP family protein [Lactobacillaceae bacterium]
MNNFQQNNRPIRRRKPVKKKNHRIRNTILLLFGGIFSVFLILFAYAYFNTSGAISGSYTKYTAKKARDVGAVLNEGRPVSILLLGTDTGEIGRDYIGRTDSMIIATINPKTKTTTMVSIPRDSMVAIPGTSFPQKLNAAYEYDSNGNADNEGHPETLIKLLQKWLNIPIDYYALVNMHALESVVNAIGGVKVSSPLTFDFDPDDEGSTAGQKIYHFTEGSSDFSITTPEGTKDYNIMNGADALAFARMRKTDPLGDYGRQLRQRLILTAISKKPAELISQTLNQKFLKKMSGNLQTDLTFDEMTTIATKYRSAIKKIKSDNIHGISVGYPVDGITVAFEVMGKTEKQRITDVLRKSLGLKKADTGTDFGGTVDTSKTGVKLTDNSISIYDPSTGTYVEQSSYY